MLKANVWFTADLHFGHDNVINYCNRPFSFVEDMDEALIANWNSRVKPQDFVFCVGDFGFGSKESLKKIFNQLQGQKCLIKGNHDKEALSLGWQWVKDYYELSLKDFDKKIILSHYAMRVWNGSYRGSLMLYGHSHGKLPGNTQSTDVGVDCWDYAPCNLDQILDRMSKSAPYFEGPAIGD